MKKFLTLATLVATLFLSAGCKDTREHPKQQNEIKTDLATFVVEEPLPSAEPTLENGNDDPPDEQNYAPIFEKEGADYFKMYKIPDYFANQFAYFNLTEHGKFLSPEDIRDLFEANIDLDYVETLLEVKDTQGKKVFTELYQILRFKEFGKDADYAYDMFAIAKEHKLDMDMGELYLLAGTGFSVEEWEQTLAFQTPHGTIAELYQKAGSWLGTNNVVENLALLKFHLRETGAPLEIALELLYKEDQRGNRVFETVIDVKQQLVYQQTICSYFGMNYAEATQQKESDKPHALFLFPTWDNGALTVEAAKNVYAPFAEVYNVQVAFIHDREDLERTKSKVTDKTKLLAINTPMGEDPKLKGNTLFFGENYRQLAVLVDQQCVLPVDDALTTELVNALPADADIWLNTCFGAYGGSDSYAGKMHKIKGHVVHTGTEAYSLDDISIQINPFAAHVNRDGKNLTSVFRK